MFVVVFHGYAKSVAIGAYDTREEAQELVDKLNAPLCPVSLEELDKPSLFSFKFSWHVGAKSPSINMISPVTSDYAEHYYIGKYASLYGEVVACSYQEAFKKIEEYRNKVAGGNDDL